MANAKKEKKYTTTQITKVARTLLRKVAQANKRSMTKEVEWLVQQEANRIGLGFEMKEDK